MLIYATRLRTSTVIVRCFLSFLAIILFLTGVLGLVGVLLSDRPETSALVFVLVTVSVSILIFRISAWSIRQYFIYEDRLDVRILWGLKKMSYPVSSLVAFNMLKVPFAQRSPGIGIMITDKKIIKVLEAELNEFPQFIESLQRIIRWDLALDVGS